MPSEDVCRRPGSHFLVTAGFRPPIAAARLAAGRDTMLALVELLVACSAAMASTAIPWPSCNCSASRSEWGNEVMMKC